MKNAIVVGFAVLLLCAAGSASAQYDPALFSVCQEQTCYLACPSGDVSFCFCISYDGAPLMAAPSNVFMTIECSYGCLYLCPAECLDKCSYLKSGGCYSVPGCGDEYCWFFRIGGCCEEALITLHMKNDPNPFYQQWVTIKTPDFDCNGVVNLVDDTYITGRMGTTDVCADLNCDGIVDAVDYGIFTTHYLHSCDNWIGTNDASWGEIKTIYR